jgi:hypothetical protein
MVFGRWFDPQKLRVKGNFFPILGDHDSYIYSWFAYGTCKEQLTLRNSGWKMGIPLHFQMTSLTCVCIEFIACIRNSSWPKETQALKWNLFFLHITRWSEGTQGERWNPPPEWTITLRSFGWKAQISLSLLFEWTNNVQGVCMAIWKSGWP